MSVGAAPSPVEETLWRMPERFDRDAAAGLTAEIEWRIGERDRYRLTIADGCCCVERGAATDPDVRLSLSAADLVRLVTGETPVSVLFLRQRLIVEGDVLLASRLPGLFPPS